MGTRYERCKRIPDRFVPGDGSHVAGDGARCRGFSRRIGEIKPGEPEGTQYQLSAIERSINPSCSWNQVWIIVDALACPPFQKCWASRGPNKQRTGASDEDNGRAFTSVTNLFNVPDVG